MQSIYMQYAFNFSGEKWASPFLEEILVDGAFTTASRTHLQKALGRFVNKWDRLYTALVTTEYNVIENYNSSETHTRQGTNTDTHSGSDTERSEGNKANNYSEHERGVYGYNSSSLSNADKTTARTNVDVSNTTTYGGVVAHGFDTTETMQRSGNIGTMTTQSMLSEEVRLRNEYDFTIIVMKDLDKVLTLSVY